VFEPEPFARFAGLANYGLLLQDGRFLNAFTHSLVYIASTLTLQLGIAYLLAVFLYFGRFAGAAGLRAAIFFPGVLSAVFVGRVWRNFVFLRGGLIYQVTRALGLPDVFLLPQYAFEIVVLIGVWQFIGFNLLIFYAGLQSLDKDVVDAARMDGAGFWSLVAYVVTPLQRHTMLLVAMLNVIFAVQLFDLPSVIGGNVLGTYQVDIAFGSRIGGPLGYASAIAAVMIGMTLVFALLRSWIKRAIDY
jgi:ABC-type sugar transport system permease subunit